MVSGPVEHPQLERMQPKLVGGQSATVLQPQKWDVGKGPVAVPQTPVQHSAPVTHVLPMALQVLHVFTVVLRLEAGTQPELPHV
jgi:hypothetical protein